jgi:hypothetical protein
MFRSRLKRLGAAAGTGLAVATLALAAGGELSAPARASITISQWNYWVSYDSSGNATKHWYQTYTTVN